MNELQLGLMGTGIVVLLGVVAYNAWQGSKARRRIPRAMKTSGAGSDAAATMESDDRPFIEPSLVSRPVVPAERERREPTLARRPPMAQEETPAGMPLPDEPELAAPVDAVAATETEPLVQVADSENTALAEKAVAVPAAVAPATHTISATPPAVVDERIDCIVALPLGAALSAERVLPLVQRMRRAGNKPIHVEGKAEAADAWEPLRSGTRYHQLRAAVQMANRAGPLNEVEFSEFVNAVQTLADAVDALPEFPDMIETVAKARELDGFAVQCDAQLSVNVRSDGAPWSANYIQAVATQDGLLLSRDGTRFVKLDTRQNPVFTLQFGDTNFLRDDLTYKGGDLITLLLDVPVADEDLLPFRLMCDYAKSMAQRIGGRVVDDQRRALPDAALQSIEKQLMTLYARLEKRGLAAGAPATRRLFSQ